MVERRLESLRLRIISALVMIPGALAAAWVGGWLLNGVVVVVALLMLGEWHRMVTGRAADRRAAAGGALIVAVLVLAGFGELAAALGVLLTALPASALVAYASGGAPGWAALGTLYIGLPSVALIWLRSHVLVGQFGLVWLFVVVWATDTGAFAVGRLVGGAKLWPRLSPNKTWAGLFGGIVLAAATGWLAAVAGRLTPLPGWVAISALVALAAEAGDLAESAVKRRFGVKDSGGLIPGHGGVLDRLDGLMFAAPVLALVVFLGGGVAGWHGWLR